MSFYQLKLYVTGEGYNCRNAESVVREYCEAELSGKYSLQVIDLEKHPQEAEEEGILAVPTLIKVEPLPKRKVIGSKRLRDQLPEILGRDGSKQTL